MKTLFFVMLFIVSCSPKPYTPIEVWSEGYKYGLTVGSEIGYKHASGLSVDDDKYMKELKKEMVKVAIRYY